MYVCVFGVTASTALTGWPIIQRKTSIVSQDKKKPFTVRGLPGEESLGGDRKTPTLLSGISCGLREPTLTRQPAAR